MQANKPTRNNPNPVAFIKIKTEPQSSARNRENNRIINKSKEEQQPDVIILSVNQNKKPNKNNPNPIQFQVKQEANLNNLTTQSKTSHQLQH